MEYDLGLDAQAQAAYTRLGWAIDRRDWDGVAAALGRTVRLDYTELFGGEVSTVSRQELCDQWRARLGALDATQHVITGALATASAGGGSVRATANVVATHVLAADAEHSPWVIGGWYEAVLEPSGDGYAVSALTLHPSWQTGSKEILGGA
jgi:hypothetical protein